MYRRPYLFLIVLLWLGVTAAQNCVPGSQEEVLAISRLRARAAWNEYDEERAQYVAPLGWVLLESRVQVHRHYRGSHSVSMLQGGRDLVTQQGIQEAYEFLLKASYESRDSQYDERARARINAAFSRHLSDFESFATLPQAIEARVWARGGGSPLLPQYRQYGVQEITVFAILRCIGGPNPVALVNEVGAMLDITDFDEIPRSSNSNISPATINVRNSCQQEVRVVIRYLGEGGRWTTDGWWYLEPGLETNLDRDGSAIRTRTGVIFFYAEVVDSLDRGVWRGDYSFEMEGRSLPMRWRRASHRIEDQYRLNLLCGSNVNGVRAEDEFNTPTYLP